MSCTCADWFYCVYTGAGGAAHQIYELLDVKHMQLDSLGYYHCNHVFVTGQFSVTSGLYDATLKFFTGNYKDVSWNINCSWISASSCTIYFVKHWLSLYVKAIDRPFHSQTCVCDGDNRDKLDV